ncbi:MAG: hypothetical protein H6842_09615 [Rhodospirillaceae bacterium]|nr:hypothetical protein [Rhodospirillaceae bacterium]
MISAIQPVSVTLIPPVRRAEQAERLALPPPATVVDTAATQPSSQAVRAVSDAYAAHQSGRASRPALSLYDQPDFAARGDARGQRLSTAGVVAVHAFALTPSLTIEPYGDVARAYAQTQGLGNGPHLTVDITV